MGGRNVVSDDEEEYEEEEEVRDAHDIEPDDEEDEEDDAEGQDEYEQDGFIVDDVEEEEEGQEEAARESSDEEMKARKKKKKRRDNEEDYKLDEDDYELLEEANVTGFHRLKSGSKKFKRLKKADRNIDDEERMVFSDEDEFEEGGRSGENAEEKIKRTLFGDDEGVPPEDIGEEDMLEGDEEMLEEEEDEMADFLVYEDEVDETGQPVRRRKSKKKIPRQAPGISSSALLEAQEIFGDVDELLTRRKQGLRARGLDGEWFDDENSNRLADEFEPSILAEKYMTPEDDKIREIDLPERIQLSEKMIGPPPSSETRVAEAVWIYDHVFGSSATLLNHTFECLAGQDKELIVSEIVNVLQLLHEKNFEIPFIAMYRKEVCRNLLQEEISATDKDNKDKLPKLKTFKALWAIQTWDMKWRLLQKRKHALEASYRNRAYDEATEDENKKSALESILASLIDAKSERTLDDIDAKFNLYFPPDEVEVEGQPKRPKRKSFYSVCRKAGFGSLSKRFGLSAEQLCENIHAMYKKNEPEDATITPEDLASEFCAVHAGDPNTVLKGARYMAAVEISCEPAVREYVRSIYMDKAVVSTNPTADGNSAIDSFHQYAEVKWLCNKPIKCFDSAQWLLVQKAEEEKLIQVTVGLPKEVIEDEIIPDFEGKYLSDGVSLAAQLWNEQRKLILKDALCKYLLPYMEKEVRSVLASRAKAWLIEEFGEGLWKKASVAPYKPSNKKENNNEEESEEDSEIRVMACCVGSHNDPTTFVMLDAYGEIVDVLFTMNFSTRSKERGMDKKKENAKSAMDKRKEREQERFLKFIGIHHPHVIVLGASSMQSKYMKDGIYEAIFELVEVNPRDMEEGMDAVNVVYADEVLPSLYENSRISQEQLPTQRGIVRRAAALGRNLQNPLAMLATLCGPGKEILSLKLHSLEDFLSPDEKYEATERIMMTVTNQVGVDINLAATHEWMFAPLQFVSGLGPRKAASLQRAILREGRIHSRRELFNLGVTKCVFFNAAGFLRVRGSGQAASGNHVMDPLDDTRIHPESYESAKKMAKDIIIAEGQQDVDMEEELEMAIEHVQKNPNLLLQLDIDAYVQHEDPNKLETLHDIKNELMLGFYEMRIPYTEPTQDEEFYLLTGESEETLSEGKIIQATVRRIQNQRVICDLVSGLTGIIMREDLSDDLDFDPLEKLSEGAVLSCRVKSIQKAKYLVDLTCRPSDLKGERWGTERIKDPYYAKKESLEHMEQEKARREEKAKQSFKPRIIVHPLFQNISAEEATQALTNKDVGESVIRPSPKGPTQLILTIKIYDGVYAHKDIKEEGKDKRDLPGMLRLGKILKIDDDTFEDLDEVIDRYLDPLIVNLKLILSYRKFRRGTKEEVDEVLRKEKSEMPSRIPYYLSVSHEYPGAFILSYIRNTNPHHEYVGLLPKGFKFRKRIFENLDMLIAYFQRHINDLAHGSVPPIRSVAAVVRRSPGPGGSAGGAGASVGSGWGGGASATSSGVGAAGGSADGWNANAQGKGTRTSIEWERSSTPGSRIGGGDYHHHHSNKISADTAPSSLPRPPHGRDRGGRGGGFIGGRRGGVEQGSRASGWDDRGPALAVNDGGRASGLIQGKVGFVGTENERNRNWGVASAPTTFNSSNFNNRWGGNVWGSKTEEWGSNSGNKVQDSPTRGWTVSSRESGWSKQENDDSVRLNDVGWAGPVRMQDRR
eukprot:TRINITY_DN3996_c1_g1_i1.p1 TRINITY_DN3996_c1_g1~~TRINITY_DN3996_c1_g1_i1.p1  ORF type:complete len:1701 (+),score=496.98 TRINITY_DN3996_c1_g1_i1:372-5474(+)